MSFFGANKEIGRGALRCLATEAGSTSRAHLRAARRPCASPSEDGASFHGGKLGSELWRNPSEGGRWGNLKVGNPTFFVTKPLQNKTQKWDFPLGNRVMSNTEPGASRQLLSRAILVIF